MAQLYPTFKIVEYNYPGWRVLRQCERLWEAKSSADKLYQEAGYKNSIVIEYDGDVIYRAQRRPFFSI